MNALAGARTQAARLIDADAAEIALVPNTNVGLNLAAEAVLARQDQRRTILISDREFPANVYPWLALERRGFTVERLPVDERGCPREDLMLEHIAAGDVTAVSVSFVQFSTGYRADIAALSEACARTNTLLVVDAIQGLGAVPLSVAHTRIDILACGGQKWLCSPWGSGFTYVRRELIQQFEPLLPGWLAFEASMDFGRLLEYRYDLLDDARRFETGSLPFQDHLGMGRSIELLLELGIDNIWQHLLGLQQPIIDWAEARGVELAGATEAQRRSGIVGVRMPDAAAAHAQLAAAGVVCAVREGAIRLSPHWYNTEEEVQRVVQIFHNLKS